MPETKQQVRYQWIRPVLEKQVSVANVVRASPFSKRAIQYWLARYHAYGIEGLKDTSTKPHHILHQTPTHIEERIKQMTFLLNCLLNIHDVDYVVGVGTENYPSDDGRSYDVMLMDKYFRDDDSNILDDCKQYFGEYHSEYLYDFPSDKRKIILF